MRLSQLVTSLLLLTTGLAAQTTIRVPADKATIQAGINAANPGDTVLVAPGIYYESINFNGKAITVTSSGGAAATTIDGGGTAGVAVVNFITKETRSSVLSNFTIQNGGTASFYGFGQGGLYISGSSPSILNNVVVNNGCNNVLMEGSAGLLQGNTIGKINTNYYSNYCSFNGVGLFFGGTGNPDPTVHLDIVGNIIENSEGVVTFGEAGAVLRNNIIRNNIGTEGAVQVSNSTSFVFLQNIVYGNSAGGVSQYPSGSGGLSVLVPSGASASAYYGLIANNVFYNNTASPSEYAATQVYFDGDVSKLVFANNIIYGGTSALPSIACNGIYQYLAATPMELVGNDVFNPAGVAYDSTCSNKVGNNLSVDPRFNNATAGDFHLVAGSPAIDTGDNLSLSGLAAEAISLPTDFDGNARIQNATAQPCAIVDMGAFEVAGTLADCAPTVSLSSSLNPSIYGQSVTFTALLASAKGVPTGTVQFLDGSTVLGTAAVSGTGAAVVTTSSLSVGAHVIAAAYQPTGTFTPAMAMLTQTVNGYPTTTSVNCSVAPISIFSSAMLMAGVASAYGTPTGSLVVTDNGSLLSTLTLNNGSASIAYTGQVVGTHSIVVSFAPSGNFAASSATCSETVAALPSLAVLTAAPMSAVYSSPITLTANVSAAVPPGHGTPTGTVTFVNGAANLATVSVANGAASTIVAALGAGVDNLTCVYSGDTVYAAGSCNVVPVTISPAATTLSLSSSANPAAALTAITFTARLSANGSALSGGSLLLTLGSATPVALVTDSNGVATYTTAGLAAGVYAVAANFAATTNYQSSSAALTENVTADPTTTSLTVAPSPGYQGQSITLVAGVTASPASLVAAGTVSLLDGTATLATVPLDGTGHANFTTTSLALGSHPLTAVYHPTVSFTASASPVVTEVILASTFTIALAPTTLTLEQGQTGSVAIQLTSLGIFSGPIALTNSSLPMYGSASIVPATVTLTPGGSGTATLSLMTAMRAANTIPRRPGSGAAPVVAFAGLLLLPLCVRRRRRLLVLMPLALLGVMGCTNSYYTLNVVPLGSYQINVTGTDSNQNAKTATLTLIITK